MLISILAFIGRLLLIILLVILVLLVLILFVPIRYRADVSYYTSVLKLEARITWLLHLVSVQIGYRDGMNVTVRIAGITLGGRKKKQEEAERQEAGKRTPDRTEETAASGAPADHQDNPDGAGTAGGQTQTAQSGSVPEQAAGRQNRTADAAESSTGQPGPAPEAEQPAGDRKRTARRKPFRRKEKTAGGDGTAKEESTLSRIRKFLADDKNRRLIGFFRDKLFRLLRHIRPKTFALSGCIGLQNPADTGQVIGAIYSFYPLFTDHIHVTGDFEQEVLEGELHAGGRLMLIIPAVILIQIICNKDARSLLFGGRRKKNGRK